MEEYVQASREYLIDSLTIDNLKSIILDNCEEVRVEVKGEREFGLYAYNFAIKEGLVIMYNNKEEDRLFKFKQEFSLDNLSPPEVMKTSQHE